MGLQKVRLKGVAACAVDVTSAEGMQMLPQTSDQIKKVIAVVDGRADLFDQSYVEFEDKIYQAAKDRPSELCLKYL